MNERVTFSCKCYVIVCAGCGKLAESERSDAVTCSTACRVRAHRNGRLKALRAAAQAWEVPVALMQQAAAIKELLPEVADEIAAGRRKIDAEVRRAVRAAFRERLMQSLRVTP